MDEKEVKKQKLVQELQWIQYRQKTLDLIEDRLLQMKELAKQAEEENLTPVVIETINYRINSLALQVRELDIESRKFEYSIVIE